MKKTFFYLLSAFVLVFASCNTRTTRPDPTPDPPDPPVSASTYYVSVDGSDDNSGIAPAFAFQTVKKALDKAKPGDVIKMLPGQYNFEGKTFLEIDGGHSGKQDKYITLQASDPANRPVITCGGSGVWNTLKILASWIIIDGLEFQGISPRLKYEDAYAIALLSHNKQLKDYNQAAIYNTNGISVGDKSTTVTNVIVRNCVIHDFPGGGLGATACDYITLENNTIYNNAWYTMYACSGISVMHPLNTDTEYDKHKIIIRGNLVYNNKTLVPWAQTADFRLSDGNGIICDINQYQDATGSHASEGPYKARTLVADNVCINNGGSGIHSYKADHVDIVHNTAYHNGYQYPTKEYGEIYSNQAKDVRFVNNIMYGRPDCPCNAKVPDASVIYTHNVYYGGVVKHKGDGDIVADPMFVKLSTDGGTADFHLTSKSGAIGNGIKMDFLPDKDKDGNPIPSTPDCGAYQFIK